MPSRYQMLAKNIGILTISNFASKILTFLLVPLYTSVLTTGEYGSYDLICTTMQLLLPILTCNISDAVMRFSLDKGKNQNEIISIGNCFIIASLIIGGLLIAADYFFIHIKSLEGLHLLSFLYFVFYVINNYLTQVAKGKEKVKAMGIAGVLSTVVVVSTNILFLLVFKFGLKGFFLASIMGNLIPSIFYFFYLKFNKPLKASINRALLKEMLQYALPLIFATIGWTINGSLDKYVVNFFCGVSAAGLVSIAYKIPTIIEVVKNIFLQAWQISAVSEYNKEDTGEFYSKTLITVNAFVCIASSLLILLTKPIASLLFAKEFYEAWKYVPFLMISTIINALGGFLGPVLSAKKDSKTMAISTIWGVVVNFAFNILLTWLMGIQGAIIATVISSLVIYIVRRLATRNLIPKAGMIKVYFSWGILIISASFEIWTAYHYFQIVSFFVLLILNWKTIKALYSRLLGRIKSKR